MASVNIAIVAGNLTRDPEAKFLPSGVNVTNFSLACSSKYKDKSGELKEEVLFIDCIAWAKTAEHVAQYLNKGSPCLVEGKLKLESWEKDGVKNSKIKLNADRVHFLGSKKDGETYTSGGSAKHGEPKDDPDNMPF